LLLAEDVRSQTSSIDEIFVNLSMEDATLKDVFQDLENQTEFSFSYNQGIIDLTEKVSVSSNESLGDLLRQLAKETKLNFKRIDGNIYVSKRKALQASVTETISRNVFFQEKTISGTVTSAEDNSGLPGVSVIVKGTTVGTVTDIEGGYTLEIPDNSTLVFSYVGFVSEEVVVGNQSVVDIVLTPDLTQLEEIVVVGYGTVKKSDLTGSVSSVKSEELTAYPAIGAVQALQGRAAGVQITANNGEPGSSFKVRVRGGTSINASSDPIFVVDGFVGATLPPPEDIESIEVLKDASATAIYGSRGANGVIMVTTKRGKTGQTKIDFNASYSTQNEINRLDLLNAEQFVDYAQDITPGFSRYTGPNGELYETDWQDEIFETGNIQNYQLGISGGSENVNYYLSGTYFDQKGIIIGSGFKRFSATSNIDIQASKKFKMGLNLFAQRTSQDGTLTQEGSGGTNSSGVVASAFKFEPDQPIYDANGRFTLARMNDAFDNAYAVATERINENVADRFQGNVFGEYSILEDLTFRTTVGVSANNGRTGNYLPTTLQGGRNIGGEGSMNGNKNSLFLNENYLTYSKEFGKHGISVMGGYSYQKSRNESWGGRGQTFITDAGLYWDLGGSSTWLAPSSNLSEWELSSYYGRLNYSFNSKYLFTFNARYDGSSTFSKNNKWAFFPSGAFAWNMKDEDFMSGVGAISQWKWRVSYGLTGNQAISPYQTLATFDNVLTIQGGNPVNAVAPNTLANDNLTWETTAQFDIGLDVGLLEDRINVIADYYSMETRDLLFGMPLPLYTGLLTTNFTSNIGRIENKGVELTLNSRNLVGEFQWDMGFNISANRNKVLELPDGTDIRYGSGPGHMVGLGETQILREGESVGVFFGWDYIGPYQQSDEILPGSSFEQAAGGEKYRDIDGTKDADGNLTGVPDGQLNSDDRMVIGNPQADFIWGFNNDFRWKGFDMNIFFQASQGNDIFSYTLMELDLLSGSNNATTAALDRWTPDNTDTDVPAAFGGRTRRASSRWILDGSFIRLKNISIGYNLPEPVLDKLNIRKLRFYVSGQNLLTITDYEGYDPEVNYRTDGASNGNRNQGLDYASYPNAKGFTFGVNLGF
jgi:TonB-linked SusC/RagA family outer membrane protein